MKEKILLKLTSGRWILTLACSGVFIYAAVTKSINDQAVAAIVTMVFQAYFNRTDRNITPEASS